MTPTPYGVCVVGGGPSGLVAAIAAAERGARTAVLERMDRVGKKLLVTGNGRCNLANLNLSPVFFHGRHREFVQPVFEQFGLKETIAFFESLGLVWKSDVDGRVFPLTDQASTVLDLLRYEIGRLRVRECCGTEIVQIRSSDGGFTAVSKHGETFACGSIVLAAGGRAAPSLGSNGSGYRLAQAFGHRVVDPFPSLVQIRLNAPYLKKLKGVRTAAGVSLVGEGNSGAGRQGEILFTDYGLSGLPALDVSRGVQMRLQFGRKPVVRIDLFPEMTEEALRQHLENRFRRLSFKKAGEACVGLLNKRLASALLSIAGIDEAASAEGMDPVESQRFARLLKRWEIEADGTRSWSEAQVTAGGIGTDEIDPRTLESKIVPGLFFAGEIVDIDGDCGGYNLQWAWSSGRVAGLHASSR